MKKKLLALLLSGAMILSLTTPVALAEEPEGECCGTCGAVECVCPPEEAPCEVCGEIECECEKIEEPEVPEAPEIPEEPTVCEICGEIECECEKIEEPEVPEAPEIPEEPTVCEICGEVKCICEGVNDYAELYEALMNCESVEEMDALMEELSEEEIDAFFDSLTEEELTALDELFFALTEEVEIEEDDREIVYPTVDYTDAAPFLDPVVGVAPRKRMMFAAPRAATQEADNGLETSKRVDPAGEGQVGDYVLTLEAWATGAKTTTTVSKNIPTDIVLILDQSMSMGYDFSTYKYTATSERDPADLYREGGDLYAKRSDGSLAPVTVERSVIGGTFVSYTNATNQQYYDNQDNLFHECANNVHGNVTVTKTSYGWYNATFTYTCENCGQLGTSNGDTSRPGSSLRNSFRQVTNATYEYTFSYAALGGGTETVSASENAPDWDFHIRSEAGTQTRLAALKNAVTIFAEDVKEKSYGADGVDGTGDEVKHRIAVIGFSGNAAGTGTQYKGSELFVGRTQYGYTDAPNHYTEAFQEMDTVAGRSNVAASINEIAEEQYTFANQGFVLANGVLNANPVKAGEQRNRVIVLFTDGVPGGNVSWDGNSNGVVREAIAEAQKAKDAGVTVYTVGIFDGADPSTAGKWDDNNTDTNNQKANYYMQNVSSNNGVPQDPSYYLAASDSVALNEIFKSISQNIESGGSTTTLDQTAVVKDVITEQFVLPEGANTDSIKVYTAQCTAENTFAAPVEFEAGVSIEGKTISVTDFNFKENWVGKETDANGKVTYHGQKLIIKIPVKVNSTALGGEHIPTNDGKLSAVYDGKGTLVEAFPVPYVDIPTTVTVKKLVDGGSTEDFGFTASYDMWDGTYTNIPENGSNYLKANGTEAADNASFSLGHDDIHKIEKVLVGSEITISEAANSKYHVASVVVKRADGTEETISANNEGKYVIMVTPGMTITFTNARSVADLKITKTGWQAIDPNQSFIFDVKNSEGKVVNRVTICENGFVVLKDLPVDTYTVEEVENWSWRYDVTKYENGAFAADLTAADAKKSSGNTADLSKGNMQVLVTNSRTEDQWLDGNNYCQNIFDGNGTVIGDAIVSAPAATTKEGEDE